MHAISPHHQVLRFFGPDAQAFLQSQLTNDVDALPIGAWQWQGYCTAKGRLLATFALARTGPTEYLAIIHRSLAAATARRLTMYRLRAKLDITLPAELAVRLHLAEPLTEPTTLTTLALGQGRWMTIEPAGEDATLSSPAMDGADFMQRWALVGITAMQPEITAATSEHFVPQMIGWDNVTPGGGVSFSKGCYPGQEVVARAHYRGAVKRHPEVVPVPSAAGVKAGQEWRLPDGRVAEICNIASRNGNESRALLVVASQSD